MSTFDEELSLSPRFNYIRVDRTLMPVEDDLVNRLYDFALAFSVGSVCGTFDRKIHILRYEVQFIGYRRPDYANLELQLYGRLSRYRPFISFSFDIDGVEINVGFQWGPRPRYRLGQLIKRGCACRTYLSIEEAKPIIYEILLNSFKLENKNNFEDFKEKFSNLILDVI